MKEPHYLLHSRNSWVSSDGVPNVSECEDEYYQNLSKVKVEDHTLDKVDDQVVGRSEIQLCPEVSVDQYNIAKLQQQQHQEEEKPILQENQQCQQQDQSECSKTCKMCQKNLSATSFWKHKCSGARTTRLSCLYCGENFQNRSLYKLHMCAGPKEHGKTEISWWRHSVFADNMIEHQQQQIQRMQDQIQQQQLIRQGKQQKRKPLQSKKQKQGNLQPETSHQFLIVQLREQHSNDINQLQAHDGQQEAMDERQDKVNKQQNMIEKQYRCEYCGKGFGNLKKRLKAHRYYCGPFKCEFCDERFRSKHEVQHHKIVHGAYG